MSAVKSSPTHQRTPAASLVIRTKGGQVYYDAKFRVDGKQVMRRIGPAWLEPVAGGYRKRPGRVPEDHYDQRSATVRAAELVAEHVAELERGEQDRRRRAAAGVTFRELAGDYLLWLERVKGAKPSTLRSHRSDLADPGTPHARGAGSSAGVIMGALGDLRVNEITTGQVDELLDVIAERGVSARTVNRYRNLVSAIFNFGIASSRHQLAANPAAKANRRREPPMATLVYYSPEEIEAVAGALAGGRHRRAQEHHQRRCHKPQTGACDCAATFQAGGRRFPDRASAEAALIAGRDEWAIYCDQQDAEAVRVAAYCGLRLGELLALRWRDVDWQGSALTINRAFSAGVETSTKTDTIRRVPLADQPAAALDRLSRRENYTGPDDLVFVNELGRRLDATALPRRFQRAREAAGLRRIRWHDLRHTFGSLLIAGGADVVTVREAMGHSKIETTSRYLHARPAHQSANLFTSIFGARLDQAPARRPARR